VDTRRKEILYIRQISHYFAHINCQLGAVYKLNRAEWEQQSKSLDAVNEWIITNLDPINHTSMLNY
jgi:hypothetical protein